jgi:hypothetical protein
MLRPLHQARLHAKTRENADKSKLAVDCKGDRDSLFHGWLPFVDLDVGPIMKIRHLHVNNALRSFEFTN